MKTAYLPTLCMLMMTGLVSCDNEETAAATDSSTTTSIPNTRSISSFTSSPQPINPVTPVASNATAATGLNPAHGQPNHRCDIAVGAPLNSAPTKTGALQTQSPVSISPVQGNAPVQVSAPVIPNSINSVNTNTTTVAAGINPPHGQPNHRCDIAVGAPLNSAPAKTAASQTQSTVSAVKPTAAPTTAAGINPPHGQPNHRCDIAVGAPLNSAPTKTVATQTQSTASTIKPTAPIAPVAPGMNPPHGQPNHRCDIAVGAPLTSAPTNKITPAATIGPVQTASPTTIKQ